MFFSSELVLEFNDLAAYPFPLELLHHMTEYRVLIVEDQREVSRLLRTALETLEVELKVAEVPSGEEAILDSTRHPIDLLVADFRLPGMTGIELMRKIHKNQPRAKTILITGQTDPRIRKEVAEAGADGFFIKPVSIADFLDAVERHLGLVETILPPEPIAALEEAAPHLPDLLAGLRQELDATTVLLISDAGKVLARAGEWTSTNLEISLISSLLLMYSAGQKISRLLGQETNSNWCVFDGGENDLIFAPVVKGQAMLVIGKKMIDEQRVISALSAFSKARGLIQNALLGMTPNVATRPSFFKNEEPVTVPLETEEKDTPDLDPFLKGLKVKLKVAEVNEFWDDALENQPSSIKPDTLSYEQARQLGLTPEDEP